MTIAACYQSTEGVVFGTDSTATLTPQNPNGLSVTVRHFNHAQKIFEIGSQSSVAALAISCFGVAEFGTKSHRTLAAEFSDELEVDPPESMDQLADRLNQKVWNSFSTAFPKEV